MGLEDSLIQKPGLLLPTLIKENHNSPKNDSSGTDEELVQVEASIDRIIGVYNNRETTVFSKVDSKNLFKYFERIFDFIETPTAQAQGKLKESNFTKEDYEDLHRLKGVLMSASSIEENANGRPIYPEFG